MGEDLNKTINSDEFAKSITCYDEQFSQSLLDLLSKIINEMSNGLGETQRIGNCLYRLDFNDHYREKLEKISQIRNKSNDSM